MCSVKKRGISLALYVLAALTNNYLNVNPNHVTENDTSVVFWECENNDDHIYEMAINARVENKMRGIESCPICRGRRRKKMHYVKKSAKKS